MRRAAKVDGNQGVIASCFIDAGCSFQSLAEVGRGCPDAVVGVAGWNVLVEIKDPAQPACKRRFTPDQKRWHSAWRGRAHVVETVDQALLLVAQYRRLKA